MMRFIVTAAVGLAFAAAGLAKLPAPTPEQQAAAALNAAKSAHGAKVAAYQLCMVEANIAEAYIQRQKAQGKVYTPEPTPACTNPGPFVPPAPVADAAPAQPAAAPTQPAAADAKK